MKIVCISDIHGKKNLLPLLPEKESDADLIIIAGDITQGGGYAEAEAILKPLLSWDRKIFAVHGNSDFKEVLEYLDDAEMNLHGKCVIRGDLGFFGLGGTCITPFRFPSEYPDAEAASILEQPLLSVAGAKKKIFVTHTPPLNSNLDAARFNLHIGSAVVRDIILKNTLDLCICGHVHESAGIEKINGCICVNIGALKDGNYAVVEILDNNIDVIRRRI